MAEGGLTCVVGKIIMMLQQFVMMAEFILWGTFPFLKPSLMANPPKFRTHHSPAL